jgi:hypothetical protein
MSSSRPSDWDKAWAPGVRALGVLCLLAGWLAACSSAVDLIPKVAGGLPENVPKRPDNRPEPLPVNAFPQRPETSPLTDDELTRLKSELTAVRDRQADPMNWTPAPAQNEADAAKAAKKPKPPIDLTPDKDQKK